MAQEATLATNDSTGVLLYPHQCQQADERAARELAKRPPAIGLQRYGLNQSFRQHLAPPSRDHPFSPRVRTYSVTT